MGTVATRVCCCCCRDFAEISAERKHCCRVARIFRVPTFWDGKTSPNTQRDVKHVAAWLRFSPSHFLGRQNARNQMFFVSFFGTSKTGVRTPRWVLNRTQLRSEWAPLPPDGCRMGRKCGPMSPCALRWVRKRIPMHSDGYKDPADFVTRHG